MTKVHSPPGQLEDSFFVLNNLISRLSLIKDIYTLKFNVDTVDTQKDGFDDVSHFEFGYFGYLLYIKFFPLEKEDAFTNHQFFGFHVSIQGCISCESKGNTRPRNKALIASLIKGKWWFSDSLVRPAISCRGWHWLVCPLDSHDFNYPPQ